MTPLQLVSPRRQRALAARPIRDFVIRPATEDDAVEIHELISGYQAEGHLLPRTLADVRRSAERFVVAAVDDRIAACGELAPLGIGIAEIRSLVVDRGARRKGLGERIFTLLKQRAEALGFERICAFTHEPRYFIRLGFSIVPHTWVPEKISTDCYSCAQFRRCGQYGMLMDLTVPAAREGAHLSW